MHTCHIDLIFTPGPLHVYADQNSILWKSDFFKWQKNPAISEFKMTLNFIIFHTVELLISRKIALHFLRENASERKKVNTLVAYEKSFGGNFSGKETKTFERDA